MAVWLQINKKIYNATPVFNEKTFYERYLKKEA